jgi:hypothetical protein
VNATSLTGNATARTKKYGAAVAIKRFFGTQQSIDADLDFFQEEAERETWLSF